MKSEKTITLISIFIAATFAFSACRSSSSPNPEKTSSTSSETSSDKALDKAAPGAPSSQSGQDTVATINGKPILAKQLEDAFKSHTQQNPQMKENLPEEQMKKLRQILLNQLIEMELILQEGEKLKIQPTDEEITARVEQIKKQYPSETEFAQKLQEQNLTLESLIQELKKNFVISKVIHQHISTSQQNSAPISDEEMKTYYDAHKDQFLQKEMVRARHILVKVPKEADEATSKKAKDKIAEILKKAKAGEAFDQLAQKNSECPSGANGGDLGFFTADQMVPEFSKVAFSLKVGEMSDIVQTQFGYHIILVTETKAASEKTFEESKEQIKQSLAGKKQGSSIRDYIQSLREKAEVKILVPELASQPETMNPHAAQ